MAHWHNAGNGLRGLITKIDKDADWVEFVRLCTERSGKIQKSDILAQDNMVKRKKNILLMMKALILTA